MIDDFALTLLAAPVNLMQLWSPVLLREGAYERREQMLFHEFGIYSGAILPVALIWVWIRRRALSRTARPHDGRDCVRRWS